MVSLFFARKTKKCGGATGKMKKFFLVLALIAAIACAGAAYAAEEPIKIGYLASMSGYDAAYGQTEVRAAQMAIEEINEAGGLLGRQLVLVEADTRTVIEDAVNGVRRLVESDGVVAIIGTNSSGFNIASAPIINRAEVPMIATCASNPAVTVDPQGSVYPYSFRLCFIDPYQGSVAANFAFTDLNSKKAAVLYNVASDYAQGLREFFKRDFEALGGEIAADEGFNNDDVDFRAQLTKIKESGADLLFLPGMARDMALAIKQADELGLEVSILGGDGYAGSMNEIAGDSMKGTYWITHTYFEEPNMAEVFKKYMTKYDDEAKEFVNVTMAYDAMYWLADAIKRAGEATGPAIAKALESTQGLELKHCTLSVDPADHNPIKKPGIILKVDDSGDLTAKFFRKVEPR